MSTTTAFAAVKAYCDSRGYPSPVPEYRFAATVGRDFRFDAAWPSAMTALEIEGGIYGRGKACPVCKRKPPGAHTSVERLKSDQEKYNLAAVMGWKLVRLRPEQVQSGEVFGLLDQLFGADA